MRSETLIIIILVALVGIPGVMAQGIIYKPVPDSYSFTDLTNWGQSGTCALTPAYQCMYDNADATGAYHANGQPAATYYMNFTNTYAPLTNVTLRYVGYLHPGSIQYLNFTLVNGCSRNNPIQIKAVQEGESLQGVKSCLATNGSWTEVYSDGWVGRGRFYELGAYINFTTNNSALLSFYDEATGDRINQTIYMTTNLGGNYTYYTIPPSAYGIQFLSGLSEGNMSISAYATPYNYGLRIMNYLFDAGGSVNISMYLTNSTGMTTFTVRDTYISAIIPDATTTQYTYIGSNLTKIEEKQTDVTGASSFNYIPNRQYFFLVYKNGYDANYFTLNPILQSAYDVRIKSTTTSDITGDYDGVYIDMQPQKYGIGVPVNFTYSILNPDSKLLSYGFNISYPGGWKNGSGTNSLGDFLYQNFTVQSGMTTDKIVIYSYYTHSVTGFHYFYSVYSLGINQSAYNSTMMGTLGRTYGMGIFERLLIYTLIMLFVVGLFSVVGRTFEGVVVGGLLTGYFVYTGFMEFWIVILPIIGIVFLLIGKGSGW